MSSDRRQCREVLEGPNGAEPGKPPRPWWRRNCKRLVQPGSDYCWQHAFWHRDEEADDVE